jgi:signal transduction histidine kinase
MKPRPVGTGGTAHRVTTVEEVRRRIARELHDDFGQRLAGLALSFQAARRQLSAGVPQMSELDAIGGGLAELGEDLRRLSHDLHPAALERRGLAAALRDHCAEVEHRHGLRVGLSVTGGEGSLPPEIALAFYRMAQEAMANTVRHAGACTARVTLRAAAGTALLVVADDGAGFDPGAARHAAGVGLASIEERAHLLGGRCRIRSAPGAGTEIAATIPLPAEGALSRLRELLVRRRGLVTSTALVVLALAAGLVTTRLQAQRAEQ